MLLLPVAILVSHAVLQVSTVQTSPEVVGESFTETATRLHPVHLDRGVAPPTKVKDAKAVYPRSAQSSHAQGIVIMEALLDSEGHVANARIMRSIPELDRAALTAVKAWAYTPPTQANGEHVAMIITVTVNFSLQ